jgi:hypothetical protein
MQTAFLPKRWLKHRQKVDINARTSCRDAELAYISKALSFCWSWQALKRQTCAASFHAAAPKYDLFCDEQNLTS